jgi:integration host factor subunit alpha
MYADRQSAQQLSSSETADSASEKKTSRTLTRYDIATAIMRRVPALSRREAQEIFQCALQEIADALSKREEIVKLHEFGTFNIRCRTKRQEQDARAPVGAPPSAHRNVSFKPSSALKRKVERGQARSRPNASSRL